MEEQVVLIPSSQVNNVADVSVKQETGQHSESVDIKMKIHVNMCMQTVSLRYDYCQNYMLPQSWCLEEAEPALLL